MKRRNHKESGVPEHLYIQVRYHTNAGWHTLAWLRSRKTDEMVSYGQAFCSPRDNPNRKIGRAIAIGRALKKYWEGVDAKT